MRRFLVLLVLALPAPADQLTYQKPPKEILDILNAPVLPALAVNPTRTYAVLLESVRYPSIAEVSAPMLRLAGIRIDPRTNGLHLAPYYTSITLIKLPEARKIKVALPPGARAGALRWSPDGKQFAFTNTTAAGPIELWLGDPATGKTHKIENVRINAVIGEPIEWLQDSKTLIVKTVPANRGPAPREPRVPQGPTVQESDGHAIGVATYEDLLENPHDEDLFEYYATSQLVKVDTETGAAAPVGKPGLLDEVSPSPDGSHLLITREHRPFSYLHPYREFPKEVEIWNPAGAVVYKVASLPLPARIPLGGVQTGPRQIRWMLNHPASLMWVEALDGGNPKEKVPNRDKIMAVNAPFTAPPAEIGKTEERFAGIQFGKDFVLVEDQARISRLLRTYEVKQGEPPKLIWSRNAQDRYKDPGRPVERRPRAGRGGGGFGPPSADSMLLQTGSTILLQGEGASPKGDHPFLDRFNLDTLKSERIFQCPEDKYETVEAVLDDQGNSFITRRESTTEPPNYILHTGKAEKALTNFTDPAPRIRKITKQLVTYKRAARVPLSTELYLPPDYKPGDRKSTRLN